MFSSPQNGNCARRRRHDELEVAAPRNSRSNSKFEPRRVESSRISNTGRPGFSGSPSVNTPNSRLYQKKPSVLLCGNDESPRSSRPEASSSVNQRTDIKTKPIPLPSLGARLSKRLGESTPPLRTVSPASEHRPRSSSQGTRSNGKINGRANSGSSSPTSHRSGVSRASTEEDLSIRVDKSTYQLMFQDIVSIKGMLLKLNRLLSESEGNITPFQEEDVTMDLKKQVAFLQQQLQQRETTLQTLQAEINKNIDHRTQSETRTLCNAATQTDRVRPVSTGPSLLQNLPSDSNIVTNGRLRKSSENLEEGSRLRLAPAETILEKVKALSFKPVEVVERRPASCKNVFKITKIDLVLKSDNYGQSELRKS